YYGHGSLLCLYKIAALQSPGLGSYCSFILKASTWRTCAIENEGEMCHTNRPHIWALTNCPSAQSVALPVPWLCLCLDFACALSLPVPCLCLCLGFACVLALPVSWLCLCLGFDGYLYRSPLVIRSPADFHFESVQNTGTYG